MRIFLPLFISLALGPAHAAVGLAHVRSETSSSGYAAFTTIYVDQHFEGDTGTRDYTGYALSYYFETGRFHSGGSFLDEGMDLYFASLNAPFTPAAISGGAFVPLAQSSSPDHLGTPSYLFPAEFYLAFETPSRSVSLSAPPAYGWAKFSNVNGTLTLMDHAVDYSGQGILVGTTTVIPEPSTFAFMVCGSLLWRRRRN